MEIDLHAKAVHLLEKIANSVHEREGNCFTKAEVQLVEQWLTEFVQEQQK